MVNTVLTRSTRRAKALVISREPKRALPPYLLLRGGNYYFKRKVPLGLDDAFPNARGGQVWKSLRTSFLEHARILLAAEVSEFELIVAKATHQKALHLVGDVKASAPVALRVPPAGAPVLSPKEIAVSAASTKPTPAPRVIAVCKTGPLSVTMRHLFESWKVKQTRHRTVQSVQSAVDEFYRLHGSTAAEAITRQHVRDYRDSLIERHLSDATIANRLGFLATLFRFGQLELIEHILGNPFERIPVNGGQRLRVEKDRRAYTVSELNVIFSSKLYTEGYRPKGQVAEAAYWATLLGPFVGGRIEEIAQLRVEDIQSVNGTWCIRICDSGSEQHIKNIGSYRRVPVHDVLIRCGFLQYVAQQAKAGHQRLFPSLNNQNANRTWSNALGKWYARYLDGLAMGDHRLDYHSFRYSFRQQCTLCGIENEQRDALTGHWITNRDSGRKYMKGEERQYPFPKLVTAMTQLRYDELKLEHLFVADPTSGLDGIRIARL